VKRMNHIVSETRVRSLLKSLSGYGLEVLVDSIVLSLGLTALGLPPDVAIKGGGAFAALTEVFCFCTHYFTERVWNKISWGRKVIEKKEDIDKIMHL